MHFLHFRHKTDQFPLSPGAFGFTKISFLPKQWGNEKTYSFASRLHRVYVRTCATCDDDARACLILSGQATPCLLEAIPSLFSSLGSILVVFYHDLGTGFIQVLRRIAQQHHPLLKSWPQFWQKWCCEHSELWAWSLVRFRLRSLLIRTHQLSTQNPSILVVFYKESRSGFEQISLSPERSFATLCRNQPAHEI